MLAKPRRRLDINGRTAKFTPRPEFNACLDFEFLTVSAGTRRSAFDPLADMKVWIDGHPAGMKTGDAIHVFKGGSIQMLTDVSIDPACDVWAANNWNTMNAAASPDPVRPTSTLGWRFGHDGYLRRAARCSRRAWEWCASHSRLAAVRKSDRGAF